MIQLTTFNKCLNEPVLLSCTSSTATCNYLPAIEEASKNNIPLIALTADRNPYYREQLENQMIIQPNMYGKYCRKSVDLPVINNEEDAKYCERLVNEAFLELNHNGVKGPVQINFPAFSGFSDFSIKELPKCRVIERIESLYDERWKKKYEKLSEAERIILLFGEGDNYSNKQEKLLDNMFDTFNCIISVEHMSNIQSKGIVKTYKITEAMDINELEKILPQIIITFGNNFSSEFKHKIREVCKNKNIEHWRVSTDGEVVDPFMALNTIFECSNIDFFEKILSYKQEEQKNNLKYFEYWQRRIENIKLPSLKFTNFYAIKKLSEIIPKNSILHLSILNSIRIMNLFDLDSSIKTYANIGAYGIDGTLSTFLGNSYNKDNLCFLLIGDLSFMYDMNSMLNDIGQNVRIIIINNYCGGEFHHVYKGIIDKDKVDKHIAASHNYSLKSWCENLDVEYHSARTFEELEKEYENLVKNHNKAQILEIYTDAEKDTEVLHEYFKINQLSDISKANKVVKKIGRGMKKICKKICLKILEILD